MERAPVPSPVLRKHLHILDLSHQAPETTASASLFSMQHCFMGEEEEEPVLDLPAGPLPQG